MAALVSPAALLAFRKSMTMEDFKVRITNAESNPGSTGAGDKVALREHPFDGTATKADVEVKTRPCLICRAAFPSAWSGERICRRCKATSNWRSNAIK